MNPFPIEEFVKAIVGVAAGMGSEQATPSPFATWWQHGWLPYGEEWAAHGSPAHNYAKSFRGYMQRAACKRGSAAWKA